ncbi:hypothetical protein DACRYDRAFT_106209 [Dacryopinax primogenitus]|uniref:Alpha-galactosidase n=1 Tax=Dacryopinax primogenitus (strain DJM 731) TaxID=1858805 RepID=M5FY97_DACPD|nr:uncharacterized protein DACRYDRAFT_106209 [Dacryopinax primogenitus]EJU03031.1 hypothetical protein DACRYDRAFT_106209 [Dacryopinax primogenitus]
MADSLVHEIFTDFDQSKVKIEGISLEGDGTTCYALLFDLKSSKSGEIDEFLLGNVGDKAEHSIRLTRDKAWWLFPTPNLDLPANTDTQFILLKLASSKYKYAALLTITVPAYMGTLRGKDGRIVARFERDSGTGGQGKIVVCMGNDLMGVVRGAADGMREVRGWGNSLLDAVVEGVERMMGNGGQGTIFSDTLTYCTWNSLFPVPRTAASVLKTLTSLKSFRIHPATLLIDDAWQSINDESGGPYTRLRSLTSFEAWDKFMDGIKGGLKEFVTRVKEDYGVERVGVWHTISGYWQGVEPVAFREKYKLVKVTLGDYPGPWEGAGFQYYIPHPDSVHQFFADYYRFLSACGVSFTKCDNVASLDALVSAREVRWEKGEGVLGAAVDMPTLRRNARQAVKDAAEKYFGGSEEGRVIWCMEMSPRIYLGKEVGGSTGARMVCRNSDDYFPDIMDSHRYHIYANVLNGIFTSQMNVVPDLDMFQSHAYIPEGEDVQKFSTEGTSAQAEYHAALRALANGPVTLTDVAGHTDPTVLDKLLGKSSKSGRSVALQAKKAFFVGPSVFEDLLSEKTGMGLKVYSEGEYGGGVLGVWNVRSKEGTAEDKLTFADILLLTSPSPERTTYAVHSFKTSKVYLADKAVSSIIPCEAPIQLEPFGFDIFTIASFVTSERCTIACLGLTDKYNPLSALTGPAVFLDNSPVLFGATFKCVGCASFVVKRLAGAGAGEEGAGKIKVVVGQTPVEETLIQRRVDERIGEIVTVDFRGLLRADPGEGDVYEMVLEVL